MASPLDIRFVPLSAPPGATLVVLAGEGLAFGPAARAIDDRTKGALTKAARAAGFSGKPKTSIEILAPAGIEAQRIIVAGVGRAANELERLLLGVGGEHTIGHGCRRIQRHPCQPLCHSVADIVEMRCFPTDYHAQLH